MYAIEIRDISFSYKAGNLPVPILKNVSLEIEEGELIAIQGPSGSGKSTLLYILGCLLKPQKGKNLIFGQDVARLIGEELAVLRNKRIGFVFQQFHLLSKADVLENILLPTRYPIERARTDEKHRKKAIQLAERLGLGNRLDHLPNQLSGGEQQRVAIARALMNDAGILLADEPTGNLDSKNSQQIMELLKQLNQEGRTVIIITHDHEVAKHCPKIYHMRDGCIQNIEAVSHNSSHPIAPSVAKPKTQDNFGFFQSLSGHLKMAFRLAPLAIDNLRRNKIRSALTMIGITTGITAVLAMVTLGQFTKDKILDSYSSLGVNTLAFYGYRNWNVKATETAALKFYAFDWEKDILPLRKIFPDVQRISPILSSWSPKIGFGGKILEGEDVELIGINSDAIQITNLELLMGTAFSPFHIDNQAPVCIIGFNIAKKLFTGVNPLGQILQVNEEDNSYGCRVIGVLKDKVSATDRFKPNDTVVLPFTFYQVATSNKWKARIRQFMMGIREGGDVVSTGKSIQSFFEQKYGKTGTFRAAENSLLLAHMNRFLTLFNIVLATIALITLGVGGMGITNMMLVSVSERFKEIGLRKALGATDLSIRIQFITESVILCSIAGLIGLIAGFTIYELIIYAASASKMIQKLEFEWILNLHAVLLSLISIIAVGILSGLMPAIKAEKLQVIEALRSE